MTVFLSPVGGAGAQFFDNNGNPLSGGKLYTYSAGTTTPQATYTSSSGAAFHTNPIVLDSAGRVPGSSEIWLSDGQVYKFVLKTSADVLLAAWDQIAGINATTTAGVVGFMARGVTNTTSLDVKKFNVVDYNYSNSYNPATGVFTAPVTGLYSIGIYGTTAAYSPLILFIAVNSFRVAAAAVASDAVVGAVSGASTSGTFLLNAGDTVTCNQESGAYFWTNAPDSTFSVALVTQI